MKISGYNPIQDIQPQRGGGASIPPKDKEQSLLTDSVTLSPEAMRLSQESESELNRGGASSIPPKKKED